MEWNKKVLQRDKIWLFQQREPTGKSLRILILFIPFKWTIKYFYKLEGKQKSIDHSNGYKKVKIYPVASPIIFSMHIDNIYVTSCWCIFSVGRAG